MFAIDRLRATGGRDVLPGLHVIDAADDEETRARIDVEQVGARGNLAKAADLAAIDSGDRCLGQPRL